MGLRSGFSREYQIRLDRRWLLLLTLLLLSSYGAAFAWSAQQGEAAVAGMVEDEGGAVAGARVRVRATENLTFSDEAGRFRLENLEAGAEVEVTAWADGYYVASQKVTPPAEGVTLTLRRYHTEDHPSYMWADPLLGGSACGSCHPPVIAQWQGNAHGQAITNSRFYSLYNGTDIDGDTAAPPGYQLDFPGTAGNCANCHAPGAAADAYLTTDMNEVRGEVTAGIHCDYCHKTGGVYLDHASGSVYPNAPGVRSQGLLRPPPGDNIFFGPFDDIHDPDTYLPLISQSAFCAPCHQFSFWGTPIYESFNEWLASPYSSAGVTCQKCHMPPSGDEYFALPGAGGLPHPPESLPSHFQLGATDETFLQQSLEMALDAVPYGRQLAVRVRIRNSGAGHHWPTDHPGRHLILTVTAVNAEGSVLAQSGGPRVPAWGGADAGDPGTSYAKILADGQTGELPVVSYWRPVRLVSDNRIPALQEAVSNYSFTIAGEPETVQITAELRFRRLFAETAKAKGWEPTDILLGREVLELAIGRERTVFLPAVARTGY